ncbi:putative diacylglycerol kinase [Leishmania major strain Friedlin]|uniref:diacylglycerol kinase (ATP) n=1 Tax=Leishmania major TaxID=5664 RepID=Q4QEN8_LEIMA|nr:putative diacylglycerol kinase [Leishmania major strain Friedlin]CAG9572170.1 diacylglycerol_kinase_-_putative [Leishmania major strain Friedlin]CAJ03988.1 putative diacylglycerol kinase [Leishmania major strain Friedlin]|eukprot:XP_001682210.1 putative diacylglycerol kinase [Leishmania major strain Friedlin]
MNNEVKPSDHESSPAAPSVHATECQNSNTNGTEVSPSSSSSFALEYGLDENNGELFSASDVTSANPSVLDPHAGGRHGRDSLPRKAFARALRSGRERAAVVEIENAVPSVPATPVQLAQQSFQGCESGAHPPAEAAASGSPAQSPQQLIDWYARSYDSGVEATYHYVVAFINLGSGETGVGEVVLGALCDELGTKRVMTLRGEVFMNPAPLRLLIKRQAVIYHTPDRPPCQQRGTVVVCGGDGTVSFIMTQLDLVRRELEDEFQPFLTASQVQLHRENSALVTSSLCDKPVHPYFTMPALAPLPLGTGNDYSNCVGFGYAFSSSGSDYRLCTLCGCGVDAGAQVATALCDAVTAPCVSFDRWEASLVPLRVAQAAVRSESSQAAAEAAQGATPNVLSKARVAASEHAAASAGAQALHSPLWNRAARPTNVANAVCLVDWAKVHASRQCATYGVINYLGVGFDAYVVKKFDDTRRAHPTVCRTRAQNKAVYGVMGIRASFRCKKLQKIIPMVCVPRPQLSGSGVAVAATRSMGSTRDFVALQLPSTAKALVLTNVNCYSAGTHPWDPKRGKLHYRPVTLRNGKVTPTLTTISSGAAVETLPTPTPRPVAINDCAFELQAMGGVLNYTSLGIGLSTSTKLIQTDEVFVFVLCTPDDLHFPSGRCSAYTQLNLKEKYESRIESDSSVRASLNVQIDGESMPPITESTIIHVRPQPGTRVLIRCRSASVVQ